jgi:ATP-dependent DNA helicase RecG
VVLQVIIRKTKAVVTANDGIPYIRRGAQSLPVDTQAKLAQLERNKGITSFENEPVPIELAKVCNSTTVTSFFAVANLSLSKMPVRKIKCPCAK